MSDGKEILDPKDIELKKQLETVKWPIEYGIITIQIRAWKPTLATIAKTVKLD